MTRREFIRRVGAAAAGGILLPGCDAPTGFTTLLGNDWIPGGDDAYPPDAVLLGIYPNSNTSGLQDAVHFGAEGAVRDVCRRLDWSWLEAGDSVFVKVVCASSQPHPAATSPHAVRAIIRELRERGAGRVLVGDQGGVQAVRLAAGGRTFGSTRQLMLANGLLDAIVESGAEPYFFDEHDYEQGYFQAKVDLDQHHWPQPPFLARVIRQVDHIIYLPRLSSHSMAGYTHGLKTAVGWLRDDSRYELHVDAAHLHEKYVEINYLPEIRDRLRLVVTLAEKVLLDSGPIVGTVADLDAWMVIASQHLANHDALAAAILAFIDSQNPESPPILRLPATTFPLSYAPSYEPALADVFHRAFVSDYVDSVTGIAWGDGDMNRYTPLRMHAFQHGIAGDAALSHAYRLLGAPPQAIPVGLLGHSPTPELLSAIQSHDGGICRVQ